MREISIVFMLALSACGGSATVSNTATNVTNVDSQNGDTEVVYTCDPLELEGGGVVYEVSATIDGNVIAGPDLAPKCPEGVSPSAVVEQAAPEPQAFEETNTGGLSQEVL